MAPGSGSVAGSGSLNAGSWGSPTATVDWCEDNYVVTPYVAEFWNTISNAAMIVPGIYAAWTSFDNKYEWRSVYSFLALAVVGVGSWCFHMTLLYPMQLLDEIPMTFAATFYNYSLIEIGRKKGSLNVPLLIALVMYFVITTVTYLVLRVHLFFLVGYAITVMVMTVCSCRIYMYRDSDPRLLVASLATYLFGFVLWNIDIHMCANVRNVRAYLADELKPVTQLHAWWHVFAGAGTYLSVLFATDARLRALKRSPMLEWYFGVLPFVTCSPGPEEAAESNGAAADGGHCYPNGRAATTKMSSPPSYLMTHAKQT